MKRLEEEETQREVLLDVTASLAAAVSLLETGGKAAKKGAASDKMFDLMVRDYKRSLDRARRALTEPTSVEKPLWEALSPDDQSLIEQGLSCLNYDHLNAIVSLDRAELERLRRLLISMESGRRLGVTCD